WPGADRTMRLRFRDRPAAVGIVPRLRHPACRRVAVDFSHQPRRAEPDESARRQRRRRRRNSRRARRGHPRDPRCPRAAPCDSPRHAGDAGARVAGDSGGTGSSKRSFPMTTITPTIRQITAGLRFPEGPVAMPDGSVILVEIERRTLSRVTPDGKIHVIAALGGGPNGAAMGPGGKIYVTNNGGLKFMD